MNRIGNMNGRFVLAFLAALLIGAGDIDAQVKWHSIEEASTAQIGNKLYFVDFYTTRCKFCIKMDKYTFSDPTVAKILNNYYYPVKFNAESNSTFTWHGHTYKPRNGQHEFASSIRGFPTFVLFRPNGTPIQQIPGFYSAKDFTIILWYFASGDCDRYSYAQYQRIFEKDIRPQMEQALKKAK